jgi:hypothetical protein
VRWENGRCPQNALNVGDNLGGEVGSLDAKATCSV